MRLYPASSFETTQRGVHALPGASDLMRELLLAQTQSDGALVIAGLAEQDLRNSAWQVQEDQVGRRLGEPPEAGRDRTHQRLRRGRYARADVVDRFARDEEQRAVDMGVRAERIEALASGRVEEAAEYARRMLPPPQQLLQEPAQTLVDSAVHAWDAGQAAEAEGLLRRAVRTAGDLGYL